MEFDYKKKYKGIIRKTKRATKPKRNVSKLKRNVQQSENGTYRRVATYTLIPDALTRAPGMFIFGQFIPAG